MTKKYNYTGERSNGKPKPKNYVTGRPTKYKEEYCDMLVEHMAQGFSFESFGAIVDTHRGHLHEWVKKYPEFSEAKTLGRTKERLFWEKLHLRCAATGEGNATMIVWAQKNKFPHAYKERVAKGSNQIDINHKQQLTATGDFKSLVATMTPEQMSVLISAIEGRTLELESSEDKKEK